MLLAGDIGGTKTDLALFTPEAGPRAPLPQSAYHRADDPSLVAMVRAFLAQTNQSVQSACFDVAGPVIDGRVRLTNLPWTLDEAALREELRLAVGLPPQGGRIPGRMASTGRTRGAAAGWWSSSMPQGRSAGAAFVRPISTRVSTAY